MSEYIQPSLQDKVVDDLPTILSLLDEYYADNHAPLVDRGFDDGDEMSWHYLRTLQHVLELDESTQALEVMYTSFHFALNLAGLAGWRHREVPGFYRQYCQDIVRQHGDNKEALTERIVADTQEYMAKNVALARVIASYGEYVASDASLISLSHTIAGLTLMQIDQTMVSRDDEGEIERLIAQLDAWDGDVSKWGGV